MGAPVSLGWEYEEIPIVTVDDFELFRTPRRRRKLHHLILNMYQRQAILERLGVDQKEIQQREREISRIKFQRNLTSTVAPLLSNVEEIIASVGRTLFFYGRRRP
jgi:hypothetical protein